MDRDAKIYVAGHRGMVGSAIVRKLSSLGYTNVVTRTHAEVDLVSQQAVMDFLGQEKPDYIFMAAAKVGGTHANNRYPVRMTSSIRAGLSELHLFPLSGLYHVPTTHIQVTVIDNFFAGISIHSSYCRLQVFGSSIEFAKHQVCIGKP